jgi:hypothetical protein
MFKVGDNVATKILSFSIAGPTQKPPRFCLPWRQMASLSGEVNVWVPTRGYAA